MEPAAGVDFLLGAMVGIAIMAVLTADRLGREYIKGVKDGRRRTIEALERASRAVDSKHNQLDKEWLEKQADTFG
jgi:gas vesicle protein